jgi:hypothetical protein
MNQNLSSKLSFEEKIVAYQKKLDEKSKLELEQKVMKSSFHHIFLNYILFFIIIYS